MKAIDKMVEWRPIAVTCGLYEVSNNGDIRRWHKPIGAHLKVSKWRGYYFFTASVDGKKRQLRVHRAVAESFLPNPLNKPQVNHKNGNKLDNRLDNLEWATAKENSIHAVKNGLNKSRGEKHPMAKLKLEDVINIRVLWALGGISQTELARLFRVGRSTVGDIIRGTKWKSI